MKISFNSSQDDTVALYEAQVLKQRAKGQAIKPTKQILLFAWFFVVIITAVWISTESPPYVLMVAFAVGLLILVFRQKFILRNYLRKHVSMSRPDGEWIPSITEINDAGITHICQDNVTAFWWSQVNEIVREDGYLRLYTHQCSVSQVPLRIFRTPDEIGRFEAEANRLWQAHKEDPPISFPEISGIIGEEANVPGCVLLNPNQPASPSEPPSSP